MVDGATTTSSRLTVLLAAPQSPRPEPWHHTVNMLLAPQGVQVLVAQTGREALDMLETRRIHVAVLDHRLPQLSGLQVVKLAREHLATRRPADAVVPAAILLTDTPSTPLLHEALGMSVFTVLAKPVNHEQLLDALARAMRRFHNSQWPGTGGRVPPAPDPSLS